MKAPFPTNILELQAVLYSVSQDCFHIEPIEQYIQINVRNSLLKLNSSDYRLIGLFENPREADRYIRSFKNAFLKKTQTYDKE